MVYVVILLSVVIMALCYILWYIIGFYHSAMYKLINRFEKEYEMASASYRIVEDDLISKLCYREMIVWEDVLKIIHKHTDEYYGY